MSRVITNRWTGRVNESTTVTQPSAGTGFILCLTDVMARCNTAATFGIYDNTTTSVLFEVDLLPDEGYAYRWSQESPLSFSAGSQAIFRLSVTGTVSDIFYNGYTYQTGR